MDKDTENTFWLLNIKDASRYKIKKENSENKTSIDYKRNININLENVNVPDYFFDVC